MISNKVRVIVCLVRFGKFLGKKKKINEQREVKNRLKSRFIPWINWLDVESWYQLNQLLRGMKTLAERVLEKRRFCLWEIRWVYLLVRRDVWCKRCWQTREYVNVSLSVWSKSVIVRKFMVRFDAVPLQIIITRITFINNHVGNIYNWINCRNKYKSIFDKCK